MRKQSKSKFNELGSLMIEAMAMLALISMVTPVLYKKAAERTTELQDINSASQMRSLVKSLDDYVRDHYDDIIEGRTVKQDCAEGVTDADYSSLKASDTAETKHLGVPIGHFCEYLPYGFLDKDKKAQDTKTFSSDYKVVLKKVDGGKGRQRVITAFLISDPKDGDLPKLRASRIASMIGSNGGYVTKSGEGEAVSASILGTQGIWGVDNLKDDLGIETVKDGSVVVSSMQGIAAQGSADNENFLYRKHQTNEELNTMETTLFMGRTAETGQNITNINQLIIEAKSTTSTFAEGNAADNALYIKNGGMTVNGGIKAANSQFTVNTDGVVDAVKYIAGSFNASDNALNLGTQLAATNSGFTLTYTNTGSWNADSGLSAAPVNINSDTKITGNLHVTGNEYIGGNLRLAGILDANKLHAREQLTVGGNTAGTGTNATVTATSSVFAAEDFRIGTNTNPRLVTNSTNTTLRGGSGGLLLESPDLVTMQATGASGNVQIKSGTGGNIDISAGSGELNMSSTADVTIDSGDNYEISLNDTMMKLNKQENTIDSIVHSFTVSNLGGDIYTLTDTANKQFATRKMRFDVTDGGGYNVFTVDPGGTEVSGAADSDKGYAMMRGRLSVTSYDETENLLQVTPSNQTASTAVVNIDNGYFKVNDSSNNVMTVDIGGADAAKTAADKGPVYVRKGVIELAANTGTTARDLSEHQGYVKADRFVANHALDDKALAKPNDLGYTFVDQGSTGAYDHYQVNPAYTSVMHDIKLTTRGGARLSDILPDFINKGIYIIDNTYKAEAIPSTWSSVDANGYHSGFDPTSYQSAADCGSTHSCEVSPWAGFVPAPQCPPGYMKVITLTPATFAMSQAGVPGPLSGSTKPDLIVDYNVRNPHEYEEGATGTDYNKSGYVTTAPTPLYFQKNTWLRSQVIPYNAGSDSSTFRGWSTVMGFIYPYTYYQKYIKLLSDKSVAGMPSTGTNKTIIWNLFPVWNQTLEGYATVYCYFNRNEAVWDSTLVDKTYDQLGAFRDVYNKSNTNYNKRLNDPTLGYTDPW